MTETQLLDRMIAEYEMNKYKYKNMSDYYKGEQDIIHNYAKFPNRANQVVIENFRTL